jgi:class 3 adenylate cyclase
MRLPTERELLIGFYDLTSYIKFAAKTDSLEVLKVLSAYFSLTGRIIAEHGGKLIKSMGDAGLCAFFAEDADAGILALRSVQREGGAFLASHGYAARTLVKVHLGPVALGLVGAPDEERLDVYGKTVNAAVAVPSQGFAMTPPAFRALSPETRKMFKKHTPPVTYIALEDSHATPER